MNKKIVIIGAGVSGIAAATRLISNGFSHVTILEAENRIGGRIHTVPFGSNVVDMGAQWCHGETENVVYELAKDKQVLDRSCDLNFEESKFIRTNGDVVSNHLAEKLTDLAYDIYEGENYEKEKQAYHGSIGNFFAKNYRKVLTTEEYSDIDQEIAQEYYDFFHKMANNLDGADSWYETSTDSHEYEDCEGDRLLNWKDKGYITVFDLLQNKIRGGENLQPVIDVIPLIQFNKDVVKIVYNQPDGLTKIVCNDGSSYSTDHVICTVSLGVLKERCLSMFDPLLTQWKYNSIDGMMIGTVDKIYLEFDTPFWDEGWGGFSILWKLEQIKEVRDDPVNGDWLEGLMAFYRFNNYQPNVLCGWISGKLARKMEEKSDADVKSGAEKVIRMILKQWNVPEAKAMIRSKWNSNPHFRGSYSNYTLKAEALGASVHKLSEPINDSSGRPVLQFAGEATSPNLFSNAHGALETGWREADRLIKLYK